MVNRGLRSGEARKTQPFDQWPEEDQLMWNEAFHAGDLFDTGPGAHLAVATRTALQFVWGRWLGFLMQQDVDILDLTLADRLTEDRLKAFADHLRTTCSSASVSTLLAQLHQVARLFAPQADWGFIDNIRNRLGRYATPDRVHHEVVSAELLVGLGFKLMDEAEAGTAWSMKRRAMHYRDGLLIAFLALCPIRRRNIAVMLIDVHLQRTPQGYSVLFGPEETKNSEPLELDLPDLIVPHFERYLGHWRLLIPGSAGHHGLWASNKQCPLTRCALNSIVVHHTGRELGTAVNLHRFRHAAATTIAIHDPESMLIAKDLLHHKGEGGIDRYYNLAASLQASRSYARLLQEMRDIKKLQNGAE
jgi:integrase/recombinase XerD